MKMILTLAWRNIWRNKGRSLALMLSVLFGMACGLMLLGLYAGFINQRFESMILNQVSHVQIHAENYIREQESSITIANENPLLQFLDTLPQMKGYATRALSFGMLASGHNSIGVKIMGINPEEEVNITRFHDNLVEGKFLSDDVKYPIYISSKAAKKLKVKLGGRVVLTFQRIDNEITAAAFRVDGIYKSSNAEFDNSHVMVKREDLQELLADEPIIHEVAILLNNHDLANPSAAYIGQNFPDLDTRSWEDISPELRILVEQGSVILYIFIIIILLGLAFGILNTMLMAVFERMQELGMLMAIGMNKTRIASMIILETAYLTLIGGGLGTVLGLLIVQYFENEGLDLSSFADALAQFGYEAAVFPTVTQQDIIVVLILVIITSVSAAIIPTLRAIHLNPAEAIRK